MTEFEKDISLILDENISITHEIERVVFLGRPGYSKTQIDIMSRFSIVMLYAVWEGFIQTSMQKYIDAINKLKDNDSNLRDRIRVYQIESTFAQFNQYPSVFNKKLLFFRELQDFFTKPKNDIPRNVNTRSNVSFAVVNNILESLGLQTLRKYYDELRKYTTDVESSLKDLLKIRNTVAHGDLSVNSTVVTKELYNLHKNIISFLLYEIALQLIASFDERKFEK